MILGIYDAYEDYFHNMMWYGWCIIYTIKDDDGNIIIKCSGEYKNDR